ncbi:PadR family transcriptional regulator [Oscillibacter ruminantium]|uniref:PadR family transcriptional regulator n=1 Tax=Oscillibacter ruminantium TaxID=1263547 RepID=UPI003333EBB1
MASAKKMDYALLGLLCDQPMTGYDLKKWIDKSLRLFWGVSYGSIYPTLSALSEDGMISANDVSTNERAKIAYTVTDKGRAYLREWLEVPAGKDEMRYETLLKLFFGGEIGPEGSLRQIEAFEEKTRAELELLRPISERLDTRRGDGESAHLYYYLTSRFGVELYEGYLRWCAEAKKLLKESMEEA